MRKEIKQREREWGIRNQHQNGRQGQRGEVPGEQPAVRQRVLRQEDSRRGPVGRFQRARRRQGRLLQGHELGPGGRRHLRDDPGAAEAGAHGAGPAQGAAEGRSDHAGRQAQLLRVPRQERNTRARHLPLRRDADLQLREEPSPPADGNCVPSGHGHRGVHRAHQKAAKRPRRGSGEK